MPVIFLEGGPLIDARKFVEFAAIMSEVDVKISHTGNWVIGQRVVVQYNPNQFGMQNFLARIRSHPNIAA